MVSNKMIIAVEPELKERIRQRAKELGLSSAALMRTSTIKYLENEQKI